MSDTPQEVVSVPVSVLRQAMAALSKATEWAAAFPLKLPYSPEDMDASEAVYCETDAALSALREVVRS